MKFRSETTRQLMALGADWYDRQLPETAAVAAALQPGEIIEGIVYGKYTQTGLEGSHGRGILAATDRRLMLIDKKPLFLRCDEITYPSISGISFSWVWFAGTILLRSRIGDLTLRTFNRVAATTFMKALEKREFASS